MTAPKPTCRVRSARLWTHLEPIPIYRPSVKSHEMVIDEAIRTDLESILKRFDPEDVLKRYDPEERLRGLDPATIEAWLSKQRRDS